MNGFFLNNGVEMPAIGLGTFPMHRFELVSAVWKAIVLGYRAFDSASAYCNEAALGAALKMAPVARRRLFVTTKLSNEQQRAGNVQQALAGSLTRLGLEYVDLYLMHWPNPGTFLSSWKQMEQLYAQGLARSIGVCNFHEHHLEELLAHANIIPAVNQIELHPLLSQQRLVAYCRSKGIQVVAYSPLARMCDALIRNAKLEAIACRHGKMVSQVVLRWDFQRGIVSIPKSARYFGLRSNIDIFDFTLSESEMATIGEINCNQRIRHDPDNCDFSRL